MRRAVGITPSGEWEAGTEIASVTLPFDDRHRRRIKLTDDYGEYFLLDLAEATRLSDGDGLVLEEGDVLAVKAAEEDVLDIRCSVAKETARIAWHLGNRHTPVQVLIDGSLRIRFDHVLEEMAQGLGAETSRLSAPFEPEAGAYAGGQSHEHSHDH